MLSRSLRLGAPARRLLGHAACLPTPHDVARPFTAPSPASKKTGYNAKGAVAGAPAVTAADAAAAQALKDEYELWIGIETHAQVQAATKLFSGASTSFHAAPNSCVSLFDAATPGTLPRLNAQCVAQAVRTGLALGGAVAPLARFDRKHYFYCDMPLGFQITQQEHPIIRGGALALNSLLPGSARSVRIGRIQLEQDSGKSLHDVAPGVSHVDLNRAGSALMEIVSEPDMQSADEAVAYLRKLQQLLRHVGASPANLEDGSMRCDVNVTVRRRPSPARPAGGAMTGRVELKNMNSLRGIARAVEHEYLRQAALDAAGQSVERETRTWDARAGATVRLRAKEDLLDYRFLPEPDLPPLALSPAWVAAAAAALPPLPDALFARFTGPGYGLPGPEAALLLQEPGAAAYLRALVGDNDDDALRAATAAAVTSADSSAPAPVPVLARPARVCWAWLCTDLLGRLKKLRGAGVAETRGGAMLLARQGAADAAGGAVSASAAADAEQNEDESDGESEWTAGLLLSSPVGPDRLGALIDMLSSGAVSGKQAKELLDVMVFEGNTSTPEEIAAMRGLTQDSDPARIAALCEQIIAVYADEAERYRAGRTNMLAFLCGQALRLSKKQAEAGVGAGEANPRVVNEQMTLLLGPVTKSPRKGAAPAKE